ncbi:AAA family ATPase [Vibrio sp. 1403]|uniref:AAA family ATPase n=1 Tax=Vibrio sp. 1403 TaxID=3074555 RepID=UPI002966E5F6|nr:AAA family ATPase [Vibrio sp. 1403]MDW3077733.1 AAA family ATPase [Vibrio sp. 1403]
MFILNSFEIKHKNKVIYDCVFNDSKMEEREDLFTTLIIGENGAGKSFLLKMLSDFFRHISNRNKPNNVKYDFFKVKYQLNENFYSIEKSEGRLISYKNNNPIDIESVEFPKKFIVLSFMVNDKFSFVNEKEGLGRYRYLGVRATSNATYTSTIQKKLLLSILNIISDSRKIPSINKVFDFVGLNGELEIVYTLKRKTLFTRKMSSDLLKSKFESILRRKEFINKSYPEEINISSNELNEFINSLSGSKFVSGNKIIYTLDFSKSQDFDLVRNIRFLDLMEKLELISSPDIKFVKDDSFDFEYTSSGEKHFIFTMINLISTIENDSLILIDEPELSLHPKWQMKYIRLLKNITNEFKTSHCILASHSHFMVSDLAPDSSSLVSLQKNIDNGMELRVSKLIPYDTYSWSAENILYEVFKLRTTRNSYFEHDLTNLLKMVSEQSTETENISKLQEKLEKYVFNENDPINVILSQSRSYLESLKHD